MLALVLAARASANEAAAATAETLFRRAQERFAQTDLDCRRGALKDLADASQLAPERSDIWIAYGRACRECGQSSKARSCLSRAARLSPSDPEVWSDLGAEWKNDWLATSDRSSLDESLRCYTRATEVAPDSSGPWCAVSALLLLEGRPRDALNAAERARRADLRGFDPLLVLGASFYRLSVLVYADSAFRMARNRMPVDLRGRFEDVSALQAGSPPRDTSGTPADGGSLWEGTDPDLTTAENEALLDYRTRLALAFFLFRERGTLRWDARTDLFVRFGPPAVITYNPARMGWGNELELTYSRPRELTHPGERDYGPGPNGFPFNMQVWDYPELGIRAVLLDRSLTQTYEIRPSLEENFDPRVAPSALADHPELISIGSGRGVFRALVPGVQPMPVTGALSRFPVGDSTSLQAHVSASGGPADSMSGSWAIVAADGTVLRRGKAVLAISACDPAQEKVATFDAIVPPGDFRVDLSVAARGGRRG
ncbi:MAG: tetratricopeptide repeat-containing protein, partial [Candidatus Eisenbacteria bacterium]